MLAISDPLVIFLYIYKVFWDHFNIIMIYNSTFVGQFIRPCKYLDLHIRYMEKCLPLKLFWSIYFTKVFFLKKQLPIGLIFSVDVNN